MAITPAPERVRKSRERKRHPIKDDDIPTHELLHRHLGAVTSSHRIGRSTGTARLSIRSSHVKMVRRTRYLADRCAQGRLSVLD
jgi:hypothetical protein